MKKYILVLIALLATASQFSSAREKDPVDFVSILVGTESKYELSSGNTYPAIARPWGMNFWTPQTGKNGDGWIYTYASDKIRGFKQTHQPSPWMNDYGQFSIMPVTTGPIYDEDKRASWFSHKAEIAKPYYYSVYLADHDVVTEITPTSRAAMFRFTFPESEMSYLVIDAFDSKSQIKIDKKANRITGYTTKNTGGVPDNFRNWFVIESNTPFETVSNSSSQTALVGFKTERGQKIELKVASSFISVEQAKLNLKELEGKSFEMVVKEGRDEWNKVLGRIEVNDDNVDHLRTFYSCLYRSVLFPRDFSEINSEGKRVHYSPYNGEICEGYLFTDTGFWDTFRSLLPFINLVYPDMSAKMQEGLVNAYLESGFLPEWASPGHRGCMIGNNSASVVADAWIKGVRGYDIDKLWEAVVHATTAVNPKERATGRLGWEYYNSLGYIPYNVGINENAARTLEYAYDDWCIYQLGKALGKPEKEIGIFALRAMNYKNLFDPETSLMRGRNEDGTFQSPFSPLKWGDAFTEGNSLHYTWSVFHDPEGLIQLMGGEEQFSQKLDSIFIIPPHFDDSYYGFPIHEIREMQIMNMGNYAHGNQPIQHMIYLYNWSRKPWKTQYWISQVMDKLYSPNPDGYCGDEDNGQTSAWYVFSALGFYPVCPGSDQYILGTPLFKEVIVNLQNGKKISISATDNTSDTPFVDQIMVNGKKYSKNYFTHKILTDGAEIVYKMSSEPNKKRGTASSDVPYSFTTRATK